MAGKLRDAGIGVAEQKEEQAEPGEFLNFDADQGGLGHAGEPQVNSSDAGGIVRGIVNKMRQMPIREVRAPERAFGEGAVMEITALGRSGPPVTAPVEAVRADQAAENREVVRAVQALNGTEMFGQENQLTFQRDAATQRMVVRIVNRKTNEVVSQIPPEYVLRLAEDLHLKTRK